MAYFAIVKFKNFIKIYLGCFKHLECLIFVIDVILTSKYAGCKEEPNHGK